VSLYLLCVEVLGRPRLGVALVACALTMPLIAAGSSLMTIDSPYTCCWGWALVFAHRAVTGQGRWAWEATGVMIALGILAKYTMVLFPVSLVMYLLTGRETRRLLCTGGFARMVAISLLSCVPILIWNAQHEWVTILHVMRLAGLAPAGETPLRAGTGLRWMGPLVYLGGQAALLLGYWFFVYLAAMIAWHPWREHSEGTRYLWWLSAPVFLVFFAFSLKNGGGELNWPVTTYLSGGVLAGAWLGQQLASERRWLRISSRVCVSMTILVGLSLTLVLYRSQVIHPMIERVVGEPTPHHPYPVRRLDPTCRLRGWRYLGSQVDALRDQLREQGIEAVLAGESWSIPGLLGVYCAGHPQAYSVGLMQGDRHSQYDLWTNPIDHGEKFKGRTFIIVGPMGKKVEEAFERVEPMVAVTYTERGRALAGWRVQVCHGFKGFAEKPRGVH
jgi:hypothetical protein